MLAEHIELRRCQHLAPFVRRAFDLEFNLAVFRRRAEAPEGYVCATERRCTAENRRIELPSRETRHGDTRFSLNRLALKGYPEM
jgi:hypothetical protein